MSISLRNVYKSIKGITVLQDVSLEIPDGAVIGLKGVNGSGKTMIMRVACGLVRCDRGVVACDGVEFMKGGTVPVGLGLLIESPAFLDGFSGRQNLMLLAQLSDMASEEEARRAIIRVGLNPDLHKPYRTYSLGMKQRLGLAAAIMGLPRHIVLDEPTNALDESGIELVRGIVSEERSRGAAILISSHDASILRTLCDTVAHVEDGRIVRLEVIRDA